RPKDSGPRPRVATIWNPADAMMPRPLATPISKRARPCCWKSPAALSRRLIRRCRGPSSCGVPAGGEVSEEDVRRPVVGSRERPAVLLVVCEEAGELVDLPLRQQDVLTESLALLRRLAVDERRHPEERAFRLDAARVGDDELRAAKQRDECVVLELRLH